jgi:hypothetical protein
MCRHGRWVERVADLVGEDESLVLIPRSGRELLPFLSCPMGSERVHT